jgi:hypothetical protein
MSMTQKRNDMDTAFFAPEFLYPEAPSNSYQTLRRDVLDSFPGIWFVTADGDGEVIVSHSENYWEKARGNWHRLPPKKLSNGLVIHWLVRPIHMERVSR